jgi:hypothetical protein
MKESKILFGLCLSFLAGIFILPGCYPEGARNIADYDVTIVRKDSAADFSQYKTFAIADSIIYISDIKGDEGLSEAAQSELINEIRTNMVNYGYLEIDVKNDTPDVALFAQILKTENTGWYWWGYWGWYGGWNPWYPCFPPYCGGGGYYPYSYEDGSLAIEMIDVRSYNPIDSTVNILWISLSNAVLSSSSNTNLQLAKDAIDQSFALSPYLDVN